MRMERLPSPPDGPADRGIAGESETAAATIEGSPFASETEITSQVNNSGKYFHSEVVGITPPEPEEFTITFDAAGGSPPASQTTVDGKLTSLPTSTRDRYNFLGWYTAGGDRVTTDTVFAADTTLYARWAEQAGTGDDDKPPYIPPQPTGPQHRQQRGAGMTFRRRSARPSLGTPSPST